MEKKKKKETMILWNYPFEIDLEEVIEEMSEEIRIEVLKKIVAEQDDLLDIVKILQEGSTSDFEDFMFAMCDALDEMTQCELVKYLTKDMTYYQKETLKQRFHIKVEEIK